MRSVGNPVMTFTGQLTLDQINNVYTVTQDIIEHLDDRGLKELMDGYDSDVNRIMDALLQEACSAMYSVGKTGDKLYTSLDYIDKLGEAFEYTLRVQSFNYFNLSVLPDFELAPHILQWGNMVQLYRLLCVIAARDHSKSFTMSFAYPLWKAYRYDSSRHASRDIQMSKSGMIITNEYKLAKMFMSFIKSEVESNHILREKLYPNSRTGWGSEEVVMKNGVTITAKSYASKMRGYHPYWMVIDDFLNESTMYSHEQKMKYINMFNSVIMNMIREDGQVVVVGTPFIAGDLYDDLKNKLGWRVFEFPAIMPDGTILWDTKHTFDGLMAKRDIIGSVNFSREILVKPISEASSVCPYDKIKIAFNNMENTVLVPNIYSHPVKFKHVSCGTDFAFSAASAADWTSYVVIGIDDYDKYWLLHVFRAKGLTYNQQMNELKNININFKPDVFVIETVGAQKIFYDMAIDEGLPAIAHATNVDKYSLYEGLPALAVLFERGDMRFPRGDAKSIEITDLIATQLSSFSYNVDKGKIVNVALHDDDSMALWQAVRGVRHCASNGFNFSFI